MKKVSNDQADGLRQLMAGHAGQRVAVVGGSAAVGVTSVTLNLAAALVQQGKDVLLHDERRGAMPAPTERQGHLLLIDSVLDLQGALSPLAAQADHILVVLQPNAASIKDCYTCIKKLHYAHALQRLRVLVNFATDAAQAQRILDNLVLASGRYLALTLEPAGLVRADPRLAQARKLNLSVVEAYKNSPAALDFHLIAANLLQWPWAASPATAGSAMAAPNNKQKGKPELALH